MAAKKRKNADGTVTYGPYKGSKENKGRPTVVHYNPKTKKTSSSNAARDAKERSLGRKLRKDEQVAHKKGTTRKHVAAKDTKVQGTQNQGDENRRRATTGEASRSAKKRETAKKHHTRKRTSNRKK